MHRWISGWDSCWTVDTDRPVQVGADPGGRAARGSCRWGHDLYDAATVALTLETRSMSCVALGGGRKRAGTA